ncbi:hypothetical protein REJC140_00556 [Pseudorhizobium endolithicum]|uniref:DUF86 domain-containing protein n=1 Tax=Pseudorhizobium endolithicum TaxID=1191678 RepID=A0ABN7JDN6_9HYPH|nr:DUF86 domain-containing protein [Pseudorhizobium endolithicum]CAD7024938.1 hypothetical protein REJC140_00556 [Pseudorhizobium endolithicum]
MSERLQLYLGQMEQAAREACQFTSGMDFDTFLTDARTQKAVGMTLIILGEAVMRLDRDYPSLLLDHPEIAWQQIIGMRNRAAHGYLTLDMKIVWETTQTSLPELLDRLHALRHWRPQGE